MPDCRAEQYRNWYPFTFFMSMMWISFYSYFMVWMITVIGTTLGIPDTVMGLTFVAAGVSVPDALSSIAVIKEGYGDMAVSNAVGSNVFDILICLGLPWFIKTAIIKPGSDVPVISKGTPFPTPKNRLVDHLFCRPDLFHVVSFVHGGVFGGGDSPQRLEVGQEVRHHPDGLVLNFHNVCEHVRVECFRLPQSTGMF
jgi:hypothetical protein